MFIRNMANCHAAGIRASTHGVLAAACVDAAAPRNHSCPQRNSRPQRFYLTWGLVTPRLPIPQKRVAPAGLAAPRASWFIRPGRRGSVDPAQFPAVTRRATRPPD